MRTRIAAIAVAIAATLAAPASAFADSAAEVSTGSTVCAAESAAGRPCVWQERDDEGVTGLARLTPADSRPVLAKVEIKTQRAWGSSWLTVASTTSLRSGTSVLATPKVATGDLSIVCVTTAPAFDLAQQVTTCTHPS
ncbi:hypothetical protein KCMC57_up62550 [Kitasatospora sp. CMC57]|uniref:Secreted protein n=1 Tax=Kitasatospora sp. CMC57 TaxID=3231513 RepID=A0AB33K3T4_9ACTN